MIATTVRATFLLLFAWLAACGEPGTRTSDERLPSGRRLPWAQHFFDKPRPEFVESAHGGLRWVGILGSPALKHDEEIAALSLLQGGKRLLSASRDGKIRLWDVPTGKEVRSYPAAATAGALVCAAVDADNDRVMAGTSDGRLLGWSLTSGKLLRSWSAHVGPVTTILPIPGSRRFVSGGDDGSLFLWEIDRDAPVGMFDGHPGRIAVVAGSPDGSTVASGGDDGIVRVWDVKNLRLKRAFKRQSGPIVALAYESKSTHLSACAKDGSLVSWDLATGEVASERASDTDSRSSRRAPPVVGAVGFSDGQWFFRNDGVGGIVGRSALASAPPKPIPLDRPSLIRGPTVTAMAGSLKGRVLATGDKRGAIRVLSDGQGSPSWASTGHQAAIHCISSSEDGSVLLASSLDGTHSLWRRESGQMVIESEFAEDGVLYASTPASVLTPSGNLVIFGANYGRILVRDRASGGITKRLERRRGAGWISSSVTALVCDRSGKTVVSAERDGTIGVWDLEGGNALQILQKPGIPHSFPFSVDISPDAKWAAFGGMRGTVQRWDIAAGKRTFITKPTGQPRNPDAVWVVRVTRDGSRVISCSNDGTLRAWNARTGAIERVFLGHEGAVLALALHPDVPWLALSGGLDCTIRLWDLRSGSEIDRISCRFIPECAVIVGGNAYIGCGDSTIAVYELKKYED